MGVSAKEEQFEHIKLFGKPALFTHSRIDRTTVPDNFYCYDLRGSDNAPGRPVTVENRVVVNYAGSVLTTVPIIMGQGKDFRRIDGQLNSLGEYLDLAQFCAEHNIALQSDNRRFTLRPASPDEAGLFYSQEEKDAELGCVGHLRMDFGHNGREFWSTWWPHNNEELNTPEFKAELDSFVNELRASGPLKNLAAMTAWCREFGNAAAIGDGGRFGYIAESEHYLYCLRCSPVPGDYNGYLYIYDKRQQKLAAVETTPGQGMEIGCQR